MKRGNPRFRSLTSGLLCLFFASIFASFHGLGTAHAQGYYVPPDLYYQSLQDPRFGYSFTNDFRTQLQNLSAQAHRNPLDYSYARRVLLGQIHLEQGPHGYFIHDVYCQKDYYDADFGRGRGPQPGQAPDDKVLNVEHTWPQSRFSGREGSTMKSDLHHLFPSDSQLNSIRGNHKFAEIPDDRGTLKCGYAQYEEYANGARFEPPANHKGNVARALFYFAVRYGLTIDADEEAALRMWHTVDPVDAAEYQRNEAICDTQGNRNPFVDHPEYVDRITDF